MKKFAVSRRALLGGAAVAAGTAALGAPGIITAHAAPAKFVFKMGHSLPVSHVGNTRLQEALTKIAKLSDGSLQIRLFPNSQLGSDTDMFSQVRSGAMEMMLLSGNIVSVMRPVTGLYNVPFAFPDYAHLWTAMDGAMGDMLRAQLDGVGLHALDKHWDNGFRQITSSERTIKGPDDLKGFKIRVPVAPIWISLFTSLGASPTAINWSELYTALQTHLVDGEENALPLIEAGKLNEVQKHVAITNHMWDGFYGVVNKGAWEQLPPDLRKLLSDTINEAAMNERRDIVGLNTQAAVNLKAAGMVFNDADSGAFRDALRKNGFYAEWKQKYGDEAWTMLEKFCGKLG